MAEMMKQRPGPAGVVRVEVPNGERVGPDLNDVLREMIWDLKEQRGWTWPETARRIAVPLNTLQGFFRETDEADDSSRRPGISVASLSRVIAAYGHGNPVTFLASHPAFRGRSPASASPELEADRRALDALCATVTAAQAIKLTALIETLVDRHAFDSWLDLTLKSLGVEPTRYETGERITS